MQLSTFALRFAIVAVPLAVLAAGCGSNSGQPGDGGTPGPDAGTGSATCGSVCARFQGTKCDSPNCVMSCEQLQSQCDQQNAGAAFQALLDCAENASLSSCGSPGTQGPCPSEANLVVQQCGPMVQPIDGGRPPPPPIDAGPPPFDGGPPPFDGGPPPPPPDGGPSGDSVCSLYSTASQCGACCAADHSHGEQTLVNAVIQCDCVMPAVCAMQCAQELCSGALPMGSDACSQCLNQSIMNGPCGPPVQSACTADPDCLAFINCQNNQCTGKP